MKNIINAIIKGVEVHKEVIEDFIDLSNELGSIVDKCPLNSPTIRKAVKLNKTLKKYHTTYKHPNNYYRNY